MIVPNPETLQDHSQVHENQPGIQHVMEAQPISRGIPTETDTEDYPVLNDYKAAGKLKDQIAVIQKAQTSLKLSLQL
jgi:hypothetical protein